MFVLSLQIEYITIQSAYSESRIQELVKDSLQHNKG